MTVKKIGCKPSEKKKCSVVAIFKSDFEFDTQGKRVNVSKIAKGLAFQMDRRYIDHKAIVSKNKVKGTLVTTRKGSRLTPSQKSAAKNLLK